MSENVKATKKEYSELIALFARVRTAIQNKEHGFICNAIKDDRFPDFSLPHRRALEIVRFGLQDHYTYCTWLAEASGNYEHSDKETRQGRLAWIDSIIAQAKRERRLAK